ncbi:MAG: endonuclease/exonuclease/phosphatase family protein [Muribaculaceae bacterium]
MIKVKHILIICILALFASCGKDNSSPIDPGWNNPGDSRADELIVMSYNIKHCAPYYGTSETTVANVNSIATIIKSKKPDVVFLQEVDKCTTRSLGIDQAKKIAELSGYPYYYFYKSMDYQGGEYGLAILSSISIKDAFGYKLPKTIDEVSIAGEYVVGTAKIHRNSKDIMIAVAHLSVYQAERDKQMPYILNNILTKDIPTIFAGDFNATPTNSTIQFLNGAEFTRTNTNSLNYTIPSNAPNREIDYISYKPSTAFSTISHTVLTGLNASDHLPIISILKITK